MTAETRKALQQGAADIREHAYKYWGKDNAKAERLEAQAKILDVLALTKLDADEGAGERERALELLAARAIAWADETPDGEHVTTTLLLEAIDELESISIHKETRGIDGDDVDGSPDQFEKPNRFGPALAAKPAGVCTDEPGIESAIEAQRRIAAYVDSIGRDKP
ncbi:MAG: hypothetical protein M0000_06380 [Actinomycetota bacterium]|nr:hypothetical protein [Actinomycetota bacterium]